ncbi:hypothetical protein Skr01_24250 [Sphaerisporangium krabiense]|nr:hypothetical protein Skr01_24250 [Sphaerisporangium krabiense]
MGRRFTPVLLGIETAIALTFFATMTASATTGTGAFWHRLPSTSPPTASSLGARHPTAPQPAPAPRRTDPGSVGVTVRVLPPGDPPEDPGSTSEKPGGTPEKPGGTSEKASAPGTPGRPGGRDDGVTVITGNEVTELTEGGTTSHDTGTTGGTTGRTGPGPFGDTTGKPGPGSPDADPPTGPAPARPGDLPFTGTDLALTLTAAGACLLLGALLIRLTTRRGRKSLTKR